MSFTHALVTRPEPQASELANRLAGDGIPTIVRPAFRFEAVPGPVSLPAGFDVAGERLLIFTSPRAVAFGIAAIPADILDDTPLAAIGPATARALAKRGHTAITSEDSHHTSEALMRHPGIRDRQGVAVIVTAPGGREALERGLEAAGWQVARAEVYRRLPLPPDAASARQLEQLGAAAGTAVSTWTSGEAMDIVLGDLEAESLAAIMRGTFIVVSRRLADRAAARGARAVRLADGPGNVQLQQAVFDAWRAGPAK